MLEAGGEREGEKTGNRCLLYLTLTSQGEGLSEWANVFLIFVFGFFFVVVAVAVSRPCFTACSLPFCARILLFFSSRRLPVYCKCLLSHCLLCRLTQTQKPLPNLCFFFLAALFSLLFSSSSLAAFSLSLSPDFWLLVVFSSFSAHSLSLSCRCSAVLTATACARPRVLLHNLGLQHTFTSLAQSAVNKSSSSCTLHESSSPGLLIAFHQSF